MKRNLQSYRRPGLLCLAIGVAASLLTTQVSRAVPYAAQVVKSGTTVNWVLNQDAQGVTIMTNGVAMTTAGATTRGAKSFTLPTADTPYSIIVTGYAAKAWTQFIPDGADRNYYYPNSVAINKNPKSPHFGKVYISNNNLAAPGNTMAGRLTTDGIYVLNADGSALSGPHTGGTNMTVDGSNYSFPYKINVNQDDNCVYLSSYYNDLAYGFNEDFSVITQLIDASNKTNTTVNVTNIYPNFVESVAAKGSRATGNLTLYGANSSYNDANHRGVRAWNIGANAAATPGDVGFQVLGPAGFSGYYASDLEIDSLGNFYTCTYRASDNQAPDVKKWDGAAALPNTTPLWDATGKHSYVRGLGVSEGGGIAAAGKYSPSTSGMCYFYDINTGASVGSLDVGNVCRDVSFDLAGNMVSVDNSLEYARFWSPGGNTTAITTSDGTFQLLQTDTLSVTATDASASETSPDTATFTVTRSGGPNGNLTVSYSLTGTAVSNVDYTISPASPFVFPEGQTSIDITVTPNDDAEREPTETVILTLAAGGNNYTLGTPAAATATIADNDVSMLFWDTDGSVYGPGGGGSPSGNWTDANWSTNPDGTVATGSYSDWAFPVFAAGIDPLGAYTVTVTGTQYVDGGSFEEGSITLDGGTLVLTNYDAMKIASGVAVIINSTLAGSSGLTVDNEGTLEIGGANIYTGTTTFRTGYVKAATSGVIPDNSTVAVRAGATFDLSYLGSGANETVGGLAGDSGTFVKLYPDIRLTVGANNANTTFSGSTGAEITSDTDPNYTAGGGTVVKIGTGALSLGGTVADELFISNGIVSINDSARLAGTTKPIVVDGGILRSTSVGIGVAMVPSTRPLTIGAAGGTLRLNDASAILFQTASIGGSGVLTKDGPGEIRTYTVAHTFPKLIVKQGMWTGGQSTSLALAESFGAIPASPLADAITIDGGAIRKAGGANLFLDPKQGITLGAAGGTIRAYGGNVGSGTFGIPGVISGTGALTVNASGDSAYGPIIVLAGNNTYSGGTTMSVGSCYVTNNGTGSGTGSGAVAVSGGTFGGDGALSGPLNLSGGTLAPGYSFNVGPLPVTAVTKAIGKLTLANGLNMTGGTFSWQLGALSTANPGADFDQLAVTGGNISVTAGTLAIAFTGTATAPVDTEPFWQTAKQWKIISLAGGGSATAGFAAITGTNGITAGAFTTTTDATGVNLVWTPAAVTPEPVTGMTVASVSGGDITINYTGGAGTRLVLLRTFDLTVPISSWERVKTNAPGTGSFVMPVGTDPKAFYVIKSE